MCLKIFLIFFNYYILFFTRHKANYKFYNMLVITQNIYVFKGSDC